MVYNFITAIGPCHIVYLRGWINLPKDTGMLSVCFLPYFERNLINNFIFRQDTASIASAGNVKRFLEQNEIPCVHLPAKSLILNLIENERKYIKHKLRNNKIKNFEL